MLLNLPLEVQNIIFKDFSLKELLSIQPTCKEFKNTVTRILQDRYKEYISISFEEKYATNSSGYKIVLLHDPPKPISYEVTISNDHMHYKMKKIRGDDFVIKKICNVGIIDYFDIKNILKYFKNIVSIQYCLANVILTTASYKYIAEYCYNILVISILNNITDKQINIIVTKCKQLVYILFSYDTPTSCIICNRLTCNGAGGIITPLGIKYIFDNCHNIKKIDIYNSKLFNKVELQLLFSILDNVNNKFKLLDLYWEIHCCMFLQTYKKYNGCKFKRKELKILKKRETMGRTLYYKNHKYIRHNIRHLEVMDTNDSFYDDYINEFGDLLEF